MWKRSTLIRPQALDTPLEENLAALKGKGALVEAVLDLSETDMMSI